MPSASGHPPGRTSVRLPSAESTGVSCSVATCILGRERCRIDAEPSFVSRAGLTFGYHNHHVEFKRFGSETAYDVLMSACDPGVVKIELDVGWAVAAHLDPVALLDAYKNRVVALHVKDVGKHAGEPREVITTAVGEGTIDWKKVLGTAYANGGRHFFYEQEPPFTRPILESAKISTEYLSKIAI